jgi:hypothetical protein
VLTDAFGGTDAISPELRAALSRIAFEASWDDLQIVAAAVNDLRGNQAALEPQSTVG